MPTATEALPEAPLCSKCETNPRANGKDSTNPWCKDCLAKYQREYKEMIAKRSSDQAFQRGVMALRKMLVGEFSRLGRATFTGREVAFAIENAPRPQQGDPVIN